MNLRLLPVLQSNFLKPVYTGHQRQCWDDTRRIFNTPGKSLQNRVATFAVTPLFLIIAASLASLQHWRWCSVQMGLKATCHYRSLQVLNSYSSFRPHLGTFQNYHKKMYKHELQIEDVETCDFYLVLCAKI